MRGSPTSACATPSRCCMPFDMPSTRRFAASASATSSSSRCRSAAPPREPASRWCSVEHLVGRVPAREAEELGEVAERGARGPRAGAGAGDLGGAGASARTSPTAILTSVDLPAPFGPSRPTSSPSPTSRSTPFSASTEPYSSRESMNGECGRHAGRGTLAHAARVHGGSRRGGGRATRGRGRPRRKDEPPAPLHPAVYGCTEDDPEPHFLGWLGDVDPDELFASGKAWGVTVRRVAVAD